MPALEGLSQRNKVSGLGLYAGILRRNDRIGAAVAALRLVLIERLADRLPRRRPVILTVVVMQIDGTARLVHRDGVEAQPHETPHGRRLIETVSAGVIGDDGGRSDARG